MKVINDECLLQKQGAKCHTELVLFSKVEGNCFFPSMKSCGGKKLMIANVRVAKYCRGAYSC